MASGRMSAGENVCEAASIPYFFTVQPAEDPHRETGSQGEPGEAEGRSPGGQCTPAKEVGDRLTLRTESVMDSSDRIRPVIGPECSTFKPFLKFRQVDNDKIRKKMFGLFITA